MFRYADENKLSDWEDIVISTNSATPTVAPFDGFITIVKDRSNTALNFYINSQPILVSDGGSTAVVMTVPVSKGDSFYLNTIQFYSSVTNKVRWYKNRDYSNR